MSPSQSAKNPSELPQPTITKKPNQTMTTPKIQKTPAAANPVKSTSSEALNYTILNSDICVKKRPDLLIWVYSAPGNFEKRDAIRQSWGNVDLYSPMTVTIVFSVAVTFNSDIQTMINSEQTKFGNMIQDAGFVDAYRNLTYKVCKFSIVMLYRCRLTYFRFV